MLPQNDMCEVPNYGSSAIYCDLPNEEQIRAGVVPLDSLPAAWWNAMWSCTNGELNKAQCELGQLIVELNNVLCNAGVCACSSCTDQLYQSIDKIRQTLANASVAGAVKSSSNPSEVAVNEQGYMSVNCLGNAASLTTSASTIVGAINELKSTYDQCFSDTATAISNKAPTSHASSATSYGVGSADNYGHLKISDTYTSVLSACSGVAASQMAVACVYCYAAEVASSATSLGNTAGCALGTAAAGSCTTAARSDHVHPYSKYVLDSSNSTGITFSYSCTGLTDPTWLAAWNGYELRAVSRTGLCVKYACCASKNGSGTAFGTAAVCSTRVGGSATYVPYAGNDGCPLLTSNFLAYWNGAYSSAGASNLRYYCGGAFGTAAKCAATAFRSCTWYPDSLSNGTVCCANKACYACMADYADCATLADYLRCIYNDRFCKKANCSGWFCVNCYVCYGCCIWFVYNCSTYPIISSVPNSTSAQLIPSGACFCYGNDGAVCVRVMQLHY